MNDFFLLLVDVFNSPVFKWIACIIAVLSVIVCIAIAVCVVIIFVKAIKQIIEQERRRK